jgi:superfamily II DNA helicase RecQ
MNIQAVSITPETLKNDLSIWAKLDNGEYQVTPADILLNPKSHFKTTMRDPLNKSVQSLALIAMDEAHTIWRYKNFRKVFKHIGKLCALFPEVPFLALSATFPPHVVAYGLQNENSLRYRRSKLTL